MKRTTLKFLVPIFLLVLAQSCNYQVYYHQYITWTLVFTNHTDYPLACTMHSLSKSNSFDMIRDDLSKEVVILPGETKQLPIPYMLSNTHAAPGIAEDDSSEFRIRMIIDSSYVPVDTLFLSMLPNSQLDSISCNYVNNENSDTYEGYSYLYNYIDFYPDSISSDIETFNAD